jgi:hypothetical protein
MATCEGAIGFRPYPPVRDLRTASRKGANVGRQIRFGNALRLGRAGVILTGLVNARIVRGN